MVSTMVLESVASSTKMFRMNAECSATVPWCTAGPTAESSGRMLSHRTKFAILGPCHSVRARKWSAILGAVKPRTGESKADGHRRVAQVVPERSDMAKRRAYESIAMRAELVAAQVQLPLRARTDSRRAAQRNGAAHNEETDPRTERMELETRGRPFSERTSAQGVREEAVSRKSSYEEETTSHRPRPRHGSNQLPKDDVPG